MKTKLDNYRIFYEVARLSSFSKAADKLYVSQSAISQSIKQLEDDLACLLFHRHHKKTTLTQEGEVLFEYIKSAINSINLGEQKLNDLKALDTGTLYIGAADTITTNFLLPYLEEFHTHYPNIHLQVSNATSLELVEMVKNGDVDIAFVNLPIYDTELHINPCIEIHDIFVAAASRQLKPSYTRTEISQLPLILLDGNSISKQYVLTEFLKSGIHLEPQIETGAHELLLEFAKIDLGISCVIKEFSTNALNSGLLKELQLKEPLVKRSIGSIYQKQFPLSNAAQSFLSLIPKLKG